MTSVPRLTKTRALVGVLLVVSLFVGAVDFAVLIYQRRQVVNQARMLADTKLRLIGNIVEAPLLQRRLSTVASVINQWAADNRNVVSLRAVAPNGFELVRFDRPDPRGGITVRGRNDVRFDGTLLLTLDMEERLDEETEKALANAYLVVLGSIAASALLVTALWITFLRSAIVPLELEITRREDFERGLKEAQAELEDRVRARTSELSQVLQRLMLHIRNTPLGYVEWNADLAVTQWNPASGKIFGYPPAEAVTRKVVELVMPPAARSVMEEDLRSLAGMPGGMKKTYENVASDGRTVHCEWYGAPLRDDEGTVIGGGALVQDVTARMLAEEEKRASERQLQHVQKLESLGILAGGIAHDFNNILTAILGNADLVLRRIGKEAPCRENVQAIHEAARRASELSLQMLAYSGKRHFDKRPVDLGDVVREMSHLLKASVSKKTDLRFELAEHLPLVDADPTQMRQVVMNLVINASEALGDKGGIVVLKTGTKDCDQACLSRRYVCEGDKEGPYVFIEVVDDGCGMSEETLGKIFDPFFSTKFSGRGLGLATVLGIARSHMGSVKVKSEVGKGTTFQVLFPRIERPVAKEDDEAGAEEVPMRAAGTVLLVDDEEMVRDVGKQMLESLGFAVLPARDGVEALEIYRDRADGIAFVLLDLTMPRMDGAEAFVELRRIRPDVKVLLCSGYSGKDTLQRFEGKGIAGFIQKPYRLKDLSAAIRSALEAPVKA